MNGIYFGTKRKLIVGGSVEYAYQTVRRFIRMGENMAVLTKR